MAVMTAVINGPDERKGQDRYRHGVTAQPDCQVVDQRHNHGWRGSNDRAYTCKKKRETPPILNSTQQSRTYQATSHNRRMSSMECGEKRYVGM